ncbi:MAG: hypothetical protein Q8N96_00795 [Methylovulum sp.]|nr:hypothetical protein [Methylovulum sp.]
MEELPDFTNYKYTPTEQDLEEFKRVHEVIHSLSAKMKSGDIDDKTRQVIESHFFDSMQGLFNDFLENPIDLQALNQKAYVNLFEAAFLIGSIIDPSKKSCLLTYSSGLFSDAFLNHEVDPRHTLTRTKYSAFQPPPRAGIITSTHHTKDAENKKIHVFGKEDLGKIVIHETPDLSWCLTLKEVAEFAVLKGYPEYLFADLLSNNPVTEVEAIDQVTGVLSDAKPAYLAESHPMFSRELSIAIEAWEQVLSSNPPKQKTGSRKKLIIDWLEKHHKNHLPKEARERIAIMLNPDRNGGAPSTD